MIERLSSPHTRLGAVALATALTLAAGGAVAGSADQSLGDGGLALAGYDPVAYFTAGEPTRGSADLTATFEGATYRFASAEHRAAFAANPDKYVPAYGGYCAYGLAMGQKVAVDPEVWEIVDGTLYLNVSAAVQERWEADIPGFIESADHNWAIVADMPAARLKEETPAGLRLGAAE